MKETSSNNTQNQEGIRMRKLIVDAPELKEGQTDSSGGIRENGKLAVQYKNPVPYVEPTLPPAVPQKIYTRKDYLKDQAKDMACEAGVSLISMLWYEFGEPFARAKLRQLKGYMISKIEGPSRVVVSHQENSTLVIEPIEADYEEIQKADDLDYDDKIIRFPNRHVS